MLHFFFVYLAFLSLSVSQTMTMTPTFSPIMCPPYSVSSTAMDTINYSICTINACPGSTIYVNGTNEKTCVGDQYIKLVDSQGVELVFDDDSSDTNICSFLQWTVNATACANYYIHEGCFENEACGGELIVAFAGVDGTLVAGVPSIPPTPAPTFESVFCPAFSASNTDTALVNYAVCSFSACEGTAITIGDCTSTCVGDQYLRLFAANGSQVAVNDDGCDAVVLDSTCSFLSLHTNNNSCQTYELHQVLKTDY